MTEHPITAAELEAMRRVHARATESTYKSVKHHLEDQDEWERMSRREWPRLMAEIERLRGMLETAMDYTEHDHQCYVDLGSPCTCRWAEEEPPIRAYLAAVGERDE